MRCTYVQPRHAVPGCALGSGARPCYTGPRGGRNDGAQLVSTRPTYRAIPVACLWRLDCRGSNQRGDSQKAKAKQRPLSLGSRSRKVQWHAKGPSLGSVRRRILSVPGAIPQAARAHGPTDQGEELKAGTLSIHAHLESKDVGVDDAACSMQAAWRGGWSYRPLSLVVARGG